MIDPPRPEVIEALKVAKGAGLRTVMVTGDYKDTAEAIARDIGLRTPDGLVLTGAEIDRLSDEELAARVDRLDVCCRVSPQHKTRIVDAFKARDHVVAMTGDGVNDAPALKRANIGVAMGITGTDVAKQTADMVLTDDNFASIVSAIEQGRIIYSNIRKFVYFLLACNVGEILIVFGAMLFGMPMPLRPVQLLWLNLVSDGAPALALGLEKGDDDIMKQPARSPKEPVINRDMAVGIGVVGIVDMIAILAVFYLAMQRYPGHLEAAQTMAFVTLCTSELDPRLRRPFRVPQHLLDRVLLESLDGRGRRDVVRPRPRGGVRAVPRAVLRRRAAHRGRLAPDAAVLLRFARRDGAPQDLLSPPQGVGSDEACRPLPQPPLPIASPSDATPVRQRNAGGQTMLKILIPVGGTRNDRFAVQDVIKRFMNDTAMEVHLLNVQMPFSAYVARFSSRKSRQDYHREQAEMALAPVGRCSTSSPFRTRCTWRWATGRR